MNVNFKSSCRNTLYCFFTNYLFEKKKKNHDVVDAKKLQILKSNMAQFC